MMIINKRLIRVHYSFIILLFYYIIYFIIAFK